MADKNFIGFFGKNNLAIIVLITIIVGLTFLFISGFFDNSLNAFSPNGLFALGGLNQTNSSLTVYSSITDSDLNNSNLNQIQGKNFVCADENESCLGTNRLVCLNNSWIDKGKVNGFCGYNPICSFNETDCNGTNYLTCDNNYSWTNNGDVNGECNYFIECVSNKNKCEGYNYLVCVNNKWIDSGKVSGKCDYQTSSSSSPISSGTVSFTKENYATNEDCITDNVCLTRGNEGGLFNSVVEESWNGSGPSDTEWSFEGHCASGSGFGSFLASLGGQYYIGSNITNNPGCLHLITDDLYYNIDFSSWTCCGNGGGFSYTRQLGVTEIECNDFCSSNA